MRISCSTEAPRAGPGSGGAGKRTLTEAAFAAPSPTPPGQRTFTDGAIQRRAERDAAADAGAPPVAGGGTPLPARRSVHAPSRAATTCTSRQVPTIPRARTGARNVKDACTPADSPVEIGVEVPLLRLGRGAIVGAGVDMAAAGKAVRALAPAARMRGAGGDVAELTRAVQALQRAKEIDASIAARSSPR